MSEKWGWWGFDLPNRKCAGTYQFYPYDTLPEIAIDVRYKDITDLEKLIDFVYYYCDSEYSVFHSPTSCFFEIDRNSSPHVFYVDQQGCIIWCLDDEGKIVTSDGVYVAKSLPEFLTRISLENSIWYKTNWTKEPLSAEESKYVSLPRSPSPVVEGNITGVSPE